MKLVWLTVSKSFQIFNFSSYSFLGEIATFGNQGEARELSKKLKYQQQEAFEDICTRTHDS